MATRWKSRTCTYRPNRHFVGRDALLKSIRKRLLDGQSQSVPASCLLLGTAGVGKTQAALEFCHRYAEDYDWQFLVTAGAEKDLRDEFTSIANRIPHSAAVSKDVVGDVIAWLETTAESWIIVFDGLRDWPSVCDIQVYTPRRCLGRSAIMFTSELTALASEVNHVFPVESLSISEGAQLLGCHVYGVPAQIPEEREAAVRISRRFSGYPLALAHIGGFINESAGSILKYERTFDTRRSVSWKGMTHATTGQYDKPMESVWEFALSESQLSANARRLLMVLSFLNPYNIPESMIVESFLADPTSWGLQVGSEKTELWDMRRSLRKRSLVSISRTSTNVSGDVFTMQRSLQHSILLQLDQDPGTRSTAFYQAFQLIRLATPKPSAKQIPNPELWPKFEMVTPHIIRLCRNFVESVPPMKGTLEFAQLLYDGGFSLWERQDSSATEDAMLILSTSLEVLDEVSYPIFGRLRADVLAVMGMCCDRLGPDDYGRSLEMRKTARRIRQAIKEQEVKDDDVSPTTDRLLYNSLNDQGIAEMQLNRFSDAERLFEECLRKYRTWGPEENYPFEYAKYYHNMGLVHMCQGRFTDAVSFLNKAVELEKRYERAKSSPLISLFAYHFASVLFHAGDTERALTMHLEILDERELLLGMCSEMALLSCYTVGAMYHHMGNLEKAEQYIKECIDRANNAENTRWPEYARGRAHMHLAKVMRARSAADNDIRPIEEIGKAVLAKYREVGESFTPMTDDDMVLYDALQPALHGRYTGRGLVPLLQTMVDGWTESFYTAGYKF